MTNQPVFVATINQPGYLPDTSDPAPLFATAREAWEYLADERTRHEDDALPTEMEDYTNTRHTLAWLGNEHLWRVADNPNVCGPLDLHLNRGPREPGVALCGSLSDIFTADVEDVTCPWCASRIELISQLTEHGLSDAGIGIIHGDTPGYQDNPLDDRGMNYVVTSIEHAAYPHNPGRLHDCPACEAKCHCADTPGDAECVFDGEHV